MTNRFSYRQTITDLVEERLRDLFVQMGLSQLPPTQQEAMTRQMLDIIGGKVSLHLEQILDAKELAMLDESKTPEELEAACLKCGISLSDMVVVETQALREDLLATSAYVRGYAEGKAQK